MKMPGEFEHILNMPEIASLTVHRSSDTGRLYICYRNFEDPNPDSYRRGKRISKNKLKEIIKIIDL